MATSERRSEKLLQKRLQEEKLNEKDEISKNNSLFDDARVFVL